MGSETRAITNRVTKQIITIFSKTCNKKKKKKKKKKNKPYLYVLLRIIYAFLRFATFYSTFYYVSVGFGRYC